MEKFELRVKDEKIFVKDNETGRVLDLNNKYHAKQLITLLNDYYNIVKNKWGL
ncbi:MAG: hypothetical protein IJH63_00710 [Methanobrevibacter sp.]|nr:hypothetical protein [Methanosphaera sp.]MBR0369225.1 hypothetical protein [Methanobrevibacter sp.]